MKLVVKKDVEKRRHMQTKILTSFFWLYHSTRASISGFAFCKRFTHCFHT